MAISIRAKKSERILFCASKWWGDPDMPENMEYPTIMVDDEGESYEYPLTFVCQINCEEIAPFDPEGQLPHEGMLYFFAAMDEWLGYESPTTNGAGEWAKGHFVVKYAKAVNFETFRSCIMVDDEDNSLTEPELEMIFEGCDDSGSGLKLLGIPDTEEVRNTYPEMISLLHLLSPLWLRIKTYLLRPQTQALLCV
jgi:uncharacterized protein YwqG